MFTLLQFQTTNGQCRVSSCNWAEFGCSFTRWLNETRITDKRSESKSIVEDEDEDEEEPLEVWLSTSTDWDLLISSSTYSITLSNCFLTGTNVSLHSLNASPALESILSGTINPRNSPITPPTIGTAEQAMDRKWYQNEAKVNTFDNCHESSW